MEQKYRVGVTGHRRLLENADVVFDKTVKALKEIKDREEARGFALQIISGMALGFDQLVCLACNELQIPYIAAVPCDNQDKLWNDKQKKRYRELLEKAAEVVVVNPGEYAPWKMHARNGWIVNNSNEMVVHWNGFFEGGTGSCMKLVKGKKLVFINIK